MNAFSKISDFLSNKYLILLVFVVCIFFAFKTFESVEEKKSNISTSLFQNRSTNKTTYAQQHPTFDLELITIDNTLSNPFLSAWLRQKAIEEKKRAEDEAEAKRVEEARKAEEERRRAEEERIKKEKSEEKSEANQQQQPQQGSQQGAPKTVPKPKQNKQFRYIGYTLVNNQHLILIEILENKRIHYVTENEIIESYKIESFDKQKLELSKDGKTYTIQKGNIVLLEI